MKENRVIRVLLVCCCRFARPNAALLDRIPRGGKKKIDGGSRIPMASIACPAELADFCCGLSGTL